MGLKTNLFRCRDAKRWSGLGLTGQRRILHWPTTAEFRTLAMVLSGFILPFVWMVPTACAQEIDFAHDVVPILKRNCVHCHGGTQAEGGFSLNSRDAVADSGHVDFDSPGDSYLLELIQSDDPDMQMPPPDRPRMSDQEVDVLRRWIEEGTQWEVGFTFKLKTYEPPLRPRNPKLPAARNGRNHPLDRILDHYLAERSLSVPAPIDDAAFLRRVSLDLGGLLPTETQIDAFVSDRNPHKRTELIDSLLTDEILYADHWLTFFNDLLRNDYSGTGFITGGRKQISEWLYESLRVNKPFDVMVRELIAPASDASRGFIDGIKWRGEVSAGQTLPIQFSQSISQSFLGINMKCASCHDSFVDRWKLTDAYGLAAIYANEKLELHRCDKPTGTIAQAAWVFPELGQIDPDAPRDERLRQLAKLMTHPENGRFSRTIVNRLWYRLMGRGLVHPLDAMQTEPWSEDLLDYLAVHLVEHDYDLKETLRLIATSSAYQSQSEVADEPAVGSDYVYRGPRSKRMTAEQFMDNVWQLTGSAPRKYDAPVIRRSSSSAESEARQPDNLAEVSGQWIWGPLNNGTVPAQQTILLRKSIQLPAEVKSGGAVITCDNAYQLFVNGKQISSGNDWSNPQAVQLHEALKQGGNQIVVIAKNEGNAPNAAGLFMQAYLELTDETVVNFQTDQTWEFNLSLPQPTNQQLGPIEGDWARVTIVPALPVWTNVIRERCLVMLAELIMGSDGMPMVRASLMKNTALMKSLGRPMREQIVSMRPDRVTTLEAIDLANEPTLANAFAVGAQRLIERCEGDADRIVRSLFRAALTREPTDLERELILEMLGDEPEPAAVQDAMWAVCMLPEFFLVR